MQVKTALISVSDKTGLEDLAKALHEAGVEILSTGGTAKKIKEAGVPVTEVADYTGAKEYPEGLVKTLHPKIHFGLLMDRKKLEHLNRAKEDGIKPIDLVVVNLYPFVQTAAKTSDLDELVANIDIGGVAMIRAAAKNFKYVAIVTDPKDYPKVAEEIKKKGALDEQTLKALATKGFNHTADYDSAIDFELRKRLLGEDSLRLHYVKGKALRYGENWHQQAKFYPVPCECENGCLSDGKVLQGKQMSYNNYVDAEAAVNAVKEINPEKEFGVAIIKHTNPCGFATSTLSLADAFERAWEGDPVSAFGSVIACNKEFDLEAAEKTKERFIEIIIAPSFSQEARDFLAKKKNLRLIAIPSFSTDCQTDWELKFITGGVLAQSKDNRLALTEKFEDLFKPAFELEKKKLGIVTKNQPSLSPALYEFAWKACKHVKSNAIILARSHENGCMVLGMGAGQPNRLDSVRKLAVTKAEENIKLIGGRIEDCVLASDAFFPFRDSIDVVAETGVKNVIQPGGSIRDDEVIQACDEKGLAMVFTGVRHFKH